MKYRYSILTFVFGGYDRIRTPRIQDPEAEYVCITDHQVQVPGWKIVVDEKLKTKDPIYASYYIRYHAHEYVDSDIIVVVDASIQINDSLYPIIDMFHRTESQMSVMLTDFKNAEDKINYWICCLKRGSDHDLNAIREFLKETGTNELRGSTGAAFTIYRPVDPVVEYFEYCWKKCLELGEDGVPNRMDEVVSHVLLRDYQDQIKIFSLSIQIIQSTYMTYCAHLSDKPHKEYKNYDQYYYLCGRPVYPYRFDKRGMFPNVYHCRTEAMLLTKHLNEADLREWLDWHLNVVKFDRIHVFDNESQYDVRRICYEYGNRVSYELVEGVPRQYRLYDSYIKYHSSAEWIMPIDDDEYLDVGEFASVYDAIRYYEHKFPHMDMLAVRWKHLFPKNFKEERTGKVLDYCTEENPELAKKFMRLGDGTVKTIVRRYGNIHYEETWENPAGGHVPKNSCFFGALTCDGRTVTGCGIERCPHTLEDERIRLLHCRYKGPSDWNRFRDKGACTVSDFTPRRRIFDIDEIIRQSVDV